MSGSRVKCVDAVTCSNPAGSSLQVYEHWELYFRYTWYTHYIHLLFSRDELWVWAEHPPAKAPAELICCWVTVSIAGCGGGSLWFFSGSTSLDNPIDDGFTSEDIIYLHFLSKVIFSQCGCFCLLFCFFNEQYSQKSGSFPMFRICGLVWFRDGGVHAHCPTFPGHPGYMPR